MTALLVTRLLVTNHNIICSVSNRFKDILIQFVTVRFGEALFLGNIHKKSMLKLILKLFEDILIQFVTT